MDSKYKKSKIHRTRQDFFSLAKPKTKVLNFTNYQKTLEIMLFQTVYDKRKDVLTGYMLDVQKKVRSMDIFDGS
ncbi:hypothetical protein ACFLYT_01675, partial [Nanoarchaeota archaeon]